MTRPRARALAAVAPLALLGTSYFYNPGHDVDGNGSTT